MLRMHELCEGLLPERCAKCKGEQPGHDAEKRTRRVASATSAELTDHATLMRYAGMWGKLQPSLKTSLLHLTITC